MYHGLNEVKMTNNKPAMFAIFTFNQKLVKNEPGFQPAENVDKEKSTSLVEKAKAYSYGKINESHGRRFNSKKYKEDKEETKEKTEPTVEREKKVREERPKPV